MKISIRSVNRDALVRAAVYALLFLFAAHAFCFFNLTYSTQSVMINASKGTSAQIGGGQYLLTFYWRLRGAIAAPLWVGLLSAVYLTLSVGVAAWLLRLERPLSLFALCGAMTVNAAVIALFAGSLHTADATLLAALLSVLAAACCARLRWGWLPGAVLMAGAMGLDPVGPACGISLAVITLCRELIDGQADRRTGMRALGILLSVVAGAAMYLAGYRVMAARYGLAMEASLQPAAGGSLLGAWLYPLKLMFEPLTAYPHANIVLRGLLLLTGLVALALCIRRMTRLRGLFLCVMALALPLLVNLPVFAREGMGQTSLAFCFLDVFLVMLVDACAGNELLVCAVRRVTVAALGVLFVGSIIFANQVYLKKNLEFQSTLSVMTRVLDRAEQVEGYQPGATPVALVGTLEDSTLSVPHVGFEHLAALDAASGNYAMASEQDNTWYMWEILGYPCNFVSSFELSQFEEMQVVLDMPVFPAAGCCQMVEGTLVIKIS
ncbi:MAG TPA: hypothetical protein IAC19_03230 [Candidatus Ventricola gallistercoris]|nr:hypothetical protein [Candidatus Ventricola gallistercoris]